ncbi:MAG TPA: SRPBCC domain-containing protein, partial [Candidatus Udaeobacter sp.]|nr:SRPBCC domain-containing protein [Candidatus Udaeobacter sp.]
MVRPASLSLEASAVPFTDEVDFVPFEPTHLKVAGIVQKRKARPRDPRRRRTRLWQEKFSAMLSWMFKLIRRRDERGKQRVTETTYQQPKIPKGEEIMSGHTIRLHRVLRATPEKVYRAFLDGDAMSKWLPPNGFTGKIHHMDAKVGG